MRPSPHSARAISNATCQACSIHYSWLTLVVNALLAVLKVVVGVLAGSKALIASALYSINDVLSGVTIVVSLRAGRRDPDDGHAYGYGKAEFVAVGIVSTLLVGAVVYVVMHSVATLIGGVLEGPHVFALPVAALAMGTTEYLARRGYCVARRNASAAARSAADNNRADSWSSVAVIISVVAGWVGLLWLDSVIAVLQALHVVWLSGVLFGESIRGLMDAALPPDVVAAIRRAGSAVPGVIEVATLRTRHVGAYAWVDMGVQVAADLPVDEADAICARVDEAIRKAAARPVRSQVRFCVRDVDTDGLVQVGG